MPLGGFGSMTYGHDAAVPMHSTSFSFDNTVEAMEAYRAPNGTYDMNQMMDDVARGEIAAPCDGAAAASATGVKAGASRATLLRSTGVMGEHPPLVGAIARL
jgi:hypothetical protein